MTRLSLGLPALILVANVLVTNARDPLLTEPGSRPDGSTHSNHAAPEARAIYGEVRRAGEVLLIARFSDDGQPDVDEVWDALTGRRFESTEAFEKLVGDAKEFDLSGTIADPTDEDARPERDVELNVEYAGRVSCFRLRLLRVEPDHHGRHWVIDPSDLETQFRYRWIRRSDVYRLDDPDRER